MKKQVSLLIAVILVLLCSGVAFFGGYKCGQSKSGSKFDPINMKGELPSGNIPNGANNNTAKDGSKNTDSSGQVVGSISAISDNNLTVQMENGSSNIVYFSNNVYVGQMTEMSKKTLATGTAVLILGSSNSDGTFIAESIQIK